MITIDSDRHVIEPIRMWRERLPARLARYAPTRRGASIQVDGQPIWRPLSPTTVDMLTRAADRSRVAIELAETPEGQLQLMDEAGLDRAVLFPTIAHFILALEDLPAEVVEAFAVAYNGFVRDYCARDPRRLWAAGVVSRHAPEVMAAAAQRLAEEGFAAAILRPNPILGRTLGSKEYEAFYATCAEAGLPVVIHEGSHARARSAGADRFTTRFGQHACSHPFEQMMAFLSLLEAGVLERHPRLRVGFFEAGAGWVPYWCWRLDAVEYHHHRDEVREAVRMRPSEYFKRQCWVTVEPDEPNIDRVVDAVGVDRLLYGSDAPHLDHDVGGLRDGALLADVARRVDDNARRFYQW